MKEMKTKNKHAYQIKMMGNEEEILRIYAMDIEEMFINSSYSNAKNYNNKCMFCLLAKSSFER